MTLRLLAFAKVNYALEVRGLRPDGYHEISTVMQSISLADGVGIERARSGFELRVEPKEIRIGPPEHNTTHRAWSLLRDLCGGALPVRVKLHKNIPAGAGLGGGSADAAATLVGLNELFGLGLSEDDLREIGARVGADVPFCLSGGTALGEGVGDALTPLPAPPDHRLLVVKPNRSASTAAVYRAHDERALKPSTRALEPVVEALRAGDLPTLARSLGNDLASVTAEAVSEMEAQWRALLASGALGVSMSGTGTSVYGVFRTEEEARAAQRAIRAHFVAVCKPVRRGVEVLADADG
jgi:4-diphosphocytidyl-2-C-methyl-D-erythritol kinase